MRLPRFLRPPAAPADVLEESEQTRWLREVRRGSDLVIAVLLAVVLAVLAPLVSALWLLGLIPVVIALGMAHAWRKTLLAQRDEARKAASTAARTAERYRERLDLYSALRPRADEASRFYSDGPTALGEFGRQMRHAVRVLREHEENASADELERLRQQLVALGDQPSETEYRDRADQVVQCISRLIGVHSPLFSDVPGVTQLQATGGMTLEAIREISLQRQRIRLIRELETGRANGQRAVSGMRDPELRNQVQGLRNWAASLETLRAENREFTTTFPPLGVPPNASFDNEAAITAAYEERLQILETMMGIRNGPLYRDLA
jgi:hypothetical protein